MFSVVSQNNNNMETLPSSDPMDEDQPEQDRSNLQDMEDLVFPPTVLNNPLRAIARIHKRSRNVDNEDEGDPRL